MTRYAELLAVATRGGRIESEHFGHVAICDVDGKLVRGIGDAQRPVYLRSSAKPFQAVTVVEIGAADRFKWTNQQLAVVCASHAAEDNHLEAVNQILKAADLVEDQLGCGPHSPFSEVARDRLVLSGKRPTKIHNNCSGKHAGMLAANSMRGWDAPTYLRADHPLQIENQRTLCRFADASESEVPTAIDGCGVPTFFLRLDRTATAFARLANPEKLGADDRAAAQTVVQAMCAESWYLAGTKIFNTTLMEFAGHRVVAKLGAEGVFCIGLPGLGLGIALKIADGTPRVHPAVVCQLLCTLLPDLNWDALLEKANPPITNTRGEPAGEYLAMLN